MATRSNPDLRLGSLPSNAPDKRARAREEGAEPETSSRARLESGIAHLFLDLLLLVHHHLRELAIAFHQEDD